MRLWCIIVINY